MISDNAKRIAIFAALGVVIFFSFLFYKWSTRTVKDGIRFEILAVPADAIITANNKEIGSKSGSLKKGTYTFKASKEGYESVERKVVLSQSGRVIVLPLAPISSEAQKWAKDNKVAYLEAEAVEGARAEEAGEAFRNKNPITRNIPHKTSYYSINYARKADNESIYVRIDSNSPLGRQVALAQIRSWGYDPTDYDIVFGGYTNPFTESEEQLGE